MAEPYGIRLLRFERSDESLLSLRCVGYNDFRYLKSTRRSRVLNYYTIHFVREGKGTLHIYGRTYPIQSGEMFFIPPGERVLYYPDEGDPWRYYWFSLGQDAPGMKLGAILGFARSRPVRALEHSTRIQALFDTLFEAESPTQQVRYTALSLLMQILALEQTAAASAAGSPSGSFADEVKDIIRLNCANPEFSVEDISQMLYVSHCHMCRRFKLETGRTPVSYLSDLRLERAAMLLQERPYSVRELCEASGFRDEAHFMKQFKKKYGLTVKGYRQSYESSLSNS